MCVCVCPIITCCHTRSRSSFHLLGHVDARSKIGTTKLPPARRYRHGRGSLVRVDARARARRRSRSLLFSAKMEMKMEMTLVPGRARRRVTAALSITLASSAVTTMSLRDNIVAGHERRGTFCIWVKHVIRVRGEERASREIRLEIPRHDSTPSPFFRDQKVLFIKTSPRERWDTFMLARRFRP